MTVSLFMKTQRDGDERVVPISTERVFEDYWQPAARKLGLKWVPLFQTGLPLEQEDIPVVLEELEKLRTAFEKPSHVPADTDEYVLGRLNLLIEELKTTVASSDLDIYIG